MVQQPGDDSDAMSAQSAKAIVLPRKVEFVWALGRDVLPQDWIANCFEPEVGQYVHIARPAQMPGFGQLIADIGSHPHQAAFDPAPQFEPGHAVVAAGSPRGKAADRLASMRRKVASA